MKREDIEKANKLVAKIEQAEDILEAISDPEKCGGNGMIKNWKYHELYMDFSSMFDGNDHPSDIDMFYLCKDNTLILGEIKSKFGTFNEGQRVLLTKVLRMHKGDSVGLFITHDKLVQNGDKVVDVSQCWVREIYIKKEGRWRKPKKAVTVKQILNYYKERARAKTENAY